MSNSPDEGVYVDCQCIICGRIFDRAFSCGAAVFDEDLLRWACESCIFDSRPVKGEPE